jgi:ABC-2 type transport system permease protein
MPEPTYIQGYEQFFKNISQLGLWVIIFALMGSVCKEKDNGSAIIVLTKPLTRATMIMSKFLVASVMFTVAYAFAYVVHIIYSLILFEAAGNIDAFLSIAMMWLYCILVIAITISMSAICKKTLTSGVMSFVILFILTILSSLPILKLDKLSPGVLATVNKVIAEGNVGKEIPNLLAGGKMEVFITWGQIGISIAITTLFIAILLFIGTKKFEKQEL